MPLMEFYDKFVRSSSSCYGVTLSRISQAGSENRAEEGALRVIPRGRHGWRFTSRIKSLCSINPGPISRPSLGHKLSKNAFVALSLSFGKAT